MKSKGEESVSEEEVAVSARQGMLTENEIYEKNIRNLYMLNNETILKNFDIRIANHIAKILRPQGAVAITNEQVEKLIFLNFHTKYSLDRKAVLTMKQLFQEEFEK